MRRHRQVATDLFPELNERRTIRAGLLSGGEQQMLVIARAVVARPAIILLDEMSLGLAPIIVSRLMRTVPELAEGVARCHPPRDTLHVLGVEGGRKPPGPHAYGLRPTPASVPPVSSSSSSHQRATDTKPGPSSSYPSKNSATRSGVRNTAREVALS